MTMNNYVHIYHHYVLRVVTDGPSTWIPTSLESGCGRAAEVLSQAAIPDIIGANRERAKLDNGAPDDYPEPSRP